MSTTVDLIPRAGGDRAAPGLVLVYAEVAAPRTIAFESGLILGREPGHGNVALPQAAISRMHVRLARGRNGCALEDLRSRNGTFVNGAPITERLLAHHDRVLVGDVLFKFVADGIADYERGAGELPAGLVGGAQIARLVDEIRVIGETTLPVIVAGETGAGKERFARAVHETSRRPGPFVALDCAALAPTVLDLALFGRADRPGHLTTAHDGTLFLDEVGELPLETQAKLRRVLETGEVVPQGATSSRHVDVRLVSSTRADLQAAVAAGTFRGDLFALLHGHVVAVPALRDRIEDVPLLIESMLGDAPRPAASFVLAACHHAWPYNVRELEQVVARARALARGGPLTSAHLPDPIRNALPSLGDASTAASRPFAAITEEPGDTPPVPDRSTLLALVVEHHGNVAAIGRALKRDRALVHRWLKRHGISLDAYRKP